MLFNADGNGSGLYLFILPFLAALLGGSVYADERLSGRVRAVLPREGRSTVLRTSMLTGVSWLMEQIVMMAVSVGLAVLLLVNCGLSFGQVTPLFIAFFALAKWLVEPFAGNWTRYVYYFWYPISPSWHTVLVQQIVPFCGYCLLLFCANAIEFSRTDRLEA